MISEHSQLRKRLIAFLRKSFHKTTQAIKYGSQFIQINYYYDPICKANPVTALSPSWSPQWGVSWRGSGWPSDTSSFRYMMGKLLEMAVLLRRLRPTVMESESVGEYCGIHIRGSWNFVFLFYNWADKTLNWLIGNRVKNHVDWSVIVRWNGVVMSSAWIPVPNSRELIIFKMLKIRIVR